MQVTISCLLSLDFVWNAKMLTRFVLSKPEGQLRGQDNRLHGGQDRCLSEKLMISCLDSDQLYCGKMNPYI